MWVSNLNNRHAVSLRRLFPAASFVGCADIHVTTAVDHSKLCTPDCLFAAIPGGQMEGQQFVQEAISRGAASLLSDQPLPNITVPQCIVPHVRASYAKLCHALVGMPTQQLKTVGITGTNGKTTTSYLIRSILNAANQPTGLLGTIEYHDSQESEASELTTPEPSQLAGWLHNMVENKATHAVLELSSHAMHQGRSAGVELDAAVITNITHDHLDYHKTMKSYRESKAKILEHCKPNAFVILNRDDPQAWSLASQVPSRLNLVAFGREENAKYRATQVEHSLEGTKFLLHRDNEVIPVKTKLHGKHNLENCLAAAAACGELEIEPSTIAQGIESLTSVRGRLESIELGQPYQIFVDFAHTDDALKRCVDTLKPLTKNRLICVFGAGGDRDRSKRPKLAKATQEADIAIVTSDNPRSENPSRIIEDIVVGYSGSTTKVRVEPDRKRAIQLALSIAQPGDTVLVAGKGHETYQIVGQTRHDFDDRLVIQDLLTATRERISA